MKQYLKGEQRKWVEIAKKVQERRLNLWYGHFDEGDGNESIRRNKMTKMTNNKKIETSLMVPPRHRMSGNLNVIIYSIILKCTHPADFYSRSYIYVLHYVP